MRRVMRGDLVEILVDNGCFAMPHERLTGIVLRVREIEGAVLCWIDGRQEELTGEYADVLINGAIRRDVSCGWLGVIDAAG